MKAILETACGCTKMIDITKIQQYIYQKLSYPAQGVYDPKQKLEKFQDIDTRRRFEYYRSEALTDGTQIAYYKEIEK